MTGAVLVSLRLGQAVQAPLFAFPGAGGEASELAALAAALPGGRPVVGIEAYAPEPGGRSDVHAIAARAVTAIRVRQPQGPYRLIGYSFGGLVALEAARRLEADGQRVAFVGLIDAVYDRRYWPLGLFAMATVRRAAGHLQRLARTSPAAAAPELLARSRALLRRLAGRAAASGGDPAPKPGASLMAHAFDAMSRYAPGPAALPVSFFASRADADYGCDPAALWDRLISGLDIRRIDAAHLGLVRDREAVAALAAALDDALAAAEAPQPPRVLLATTFNWVSTSRLALGFAEAGFAVQAAAPRRHSLWRLGFLERLHRVRALSLIDSFEAAIRAARPDLVIPTDDRSAQALHALHARTDPDTLDGAALRLRLERSLGRADTYPIAYSRAATLQLAEEAGVRRPRTERVRSLAELAGWIDAHGLPAVLKSDGSWGGREVVFIREPGGVARALRRLHSPANPARALKRLLVDGDAAPIRDVVLRRRPQLSAQAFVAGTPGNAAVACLDGEVLAAVYVEVVKSQGAVGPATVVRVLDHPEMARAAEAMVRRLGLTGLCGFDFILDPLTGAAHLIEINPRATPTAHLIGADGADLLAALAAGLERRAATRRPPPDYAGGLVALFPQELRRDPVSDYLRSAHHDVPWHAPDLVDAALAEANASRAVLDRLTRPFQRSAEV